MEMTSCMAARRVVLKLILSTSLPNTELPIAVQKSHEASMAPSESSFP